VSEIGDRIKALRQERGERLGDLGAAAGLSASAVHQWESGTTKGLRPANLVAVADHYNVSIRWLVTGVGPQRVTETRTEFEFQAIELFRKLTEDGQHAALAHLNWMAAQESTDAAPSAIDPFPRIKKARVR
jgi:transcriptional regulator with XRE-family HTH domain